MVDERTATELRAVVAGVRIAGPGAVWFGGELVPLTAAPQAGGGWPVDPIPALQRLLYDRCYCRPFGEPLPAAAWYPGPDDSLLDALDAANATAERWERGWVVTAALPHGQVEASRSGRTRTFAPGEYVLTDGSPSPAAGAPLTVYAPRGSRLLQDGFYFAYGAALLDPAAEHSVVRLYWNVTDAGAPYLVHALTAGLNRFRVPFRLKALTSRAQYGRADAAVVYLAARHFRVAATVAGRVHAALRDHLGERTPLFAKRLAPGLGLAEDPGNGESFGMQRCRVLADALWHADAGGQTDEDARWEAVRARLAEHGVDADRPYLRPHCIDRYELP